MIAIIVLLTGGVDTLSLTFEQALERAYQNAPEVRLAGVDIEQQELERQKALSEFFPQITTQGQAMRLSEPPSFTFDFSGVELDVTLGDEYIYQLQTGVQIPLWTFGRRYQGFMLAEEAVKLARLDSLDRCRKVRMHVAEIFANTRSLEVSEGLLETAIDNATRHRLEIEKKYNQGLVSHLELIQAQTREAELVPELVEVKRQQQNLRSQIAIFLNPGEDTIIAFDFGEGVIVDTLIPEVSSEQVLGLCPAWLQLQLGKQMIDRQIKIKQREALPVLAAGGSYAVQRSPLSDGEWDGDWSYTLSLQAPIHKGFTNYAEVKRLEKEIIKLDIQEQALAAQIESDLTEAVSEWELALTTLHAADMKVAESMALLDMVKKRYREGLVSDIDLLDAELGLRSARTDRVMAERDVMVARERFITVVGGLK